MGTRVTIRPDLMDRVGRSADDLLRDLTEAVLADAKRLVPVDTGELHDSLEAEVSDGVGRVGSNARHAGLVEDGTSRMAAQPYLKPALYRLRGGE